MKQQPTQFGHAMQLAEARERIAELQAEVEASCKRIDDLLQVFAELQKERDTARALIVAYRRLLRLMPEVAAWGTDHANVASWQKYRDELEKRAQSLLFGEEKTQ